MNRLNYFNPYQSKQGSHEDQLTRAYLVLLKHSSHAFFTFMEYCKSKHVTANDEKPISVIEFLEQGWEIETQKGNPEINTNYLLSVLITDSHIASEESSIKVSERNARYDGVITFGTNLTIIIENKPRSSNVWFGELEPSRQNLSEDTIIYSHYAELEWKEIIKQLTHLLKIPTVSGYEKIIIDDFLSYVDENFPYLNPYDSFHLCKGNPELIIRRTENILKSISLDEGNVKHQSGWGYYILTNYPQIQMIGLILEQDEKGWHLELCLYFGDSQRQAISFFNSSPTIDHLVNTKWIIKPHFHVAFRNSNLAKFQSDDINHYLDFWKLNVERICQQRRDEVPQYFKWLTDERVISFTEDDRLTLTKKFYNTAMQRLNICPGFSLIYQFTSLEVEELDKTDKLKKLISEKIKEGLKVVNINCDDLIKSFE